MSYFLRFQDRQNKKSKNLFNSGSLVRLMNYMNKKLRMDKKAEKNDFIDELIKCGLDPDEAELYFHIIKYDGNVFEILEYMPGYGKWAINDPEIQKLLTENLDSLLEKDLIHKPPLLGSGVQRYHYKPWFQSKFGKNLTAQQNERLLDLWNIYCGSV